MQAAFQIIGYPSITDLRMEFGHVSIPEVWTAFMITSIIFKKPDTFTALQQVNTHCVFFQFNYHSMTSKDTCIRQHIEFTKHMFGSNNEMHIGRT